MAADLETVPDVELTAAEMLAGLAGRLEDVRRTLVIAHDIGQVREVIRLEGAADEVRVYPTVEAAIEAPSATTPADDATMPAEAAEGPE